MEVFFENSLVLEILRISLMDYIIRFLHFVNPVGLLRSKKTLSTYFIFIILGIKVKVKRREYP